VIAALGWIQEYAHFPNLGITFPPGLAFVATVTLAFFGILGRLAIDSVAEPVLDTISALPLERLELRLLRDIRAAGDRFAVGSASVAPSPVEPIGPILERLVQVLEQDRHSLRQLTAQLFETAETLNANAKTVSKRPVDAARAESNSGLAPELKTVIDRLSLTLDHLAARIERTPVMPLLNGADTHSKGAARLNGPLREELRALLKDFE